MRKQPRVLVPTPFTFLVSPEDVSPKTPVSSEEPATRNGPTEDEASAAFESMSAENDSPFDHPDEKSPFDAAEGWDGGAVGPGPSGHSHHEWSISRPTHPSVSRMTRDAFRR